MLYCCLEFAKDGVRFERGKGQVIKLKSVAATTLDHLYEPSAYSTLAILSRGVSLISPTLG